MRAFQPVGYALLIVALGVPAQGRPDQPSPEPDDGFGSPKAVFDAMNKAAKKKDYKTVMKCLAPESRDRMVANLTVAGGSLRTLADLNGDAKMKEVAAEFEKTLVKHGVTKEAVAKFESAKGSEEGAKAAKALAAPVKDKAAFMSDITALFDKMAPGKVERPEPELADVKITGRKARGAMVLKVYGRERSQPIDFVKIGGGWLVVVPDVKAIPVRPANPKKATTEKK